MKSNEIPNGRKLIRLEKLTGKKTGGPEDLARLVDARVEYDSSRTVEVRVGNTTLEFAPNMVTSGEGNLIGVAVAVPRDDYWVKVKDSEFPPARFARGGNMMIGREMGVAISNPDRNRIDLDELRARLGASEAVAADHGVSRIHATVVFGLDGRLLIEDYCSTNGTEISVYQQ